MALALRTSRTSHILLRTIPIRPAVVVVRLPVQRIHRRTFIGQVIGVIANPFETLRQLDESRKLLEQTRQDMRDAYEKSQIPSMHTFSRLPGYFPRPREEEAIIKILTGIPSFTVLFGASRFLPPIDDFRETKADGSVGKTALLRQVLTDPRFHVVHFDLRIAGFADVTSLYMSLAAQFEHFFENLALELEGYEEMKKHALTFKHAWMDWEKRMSKPENQMKVSVADVAGLMEKFQSALLQYWNYEPERKDKPDNPRQQNQEPAERVVKSEGSETGSHPQASDEKPPPPTKKMPVFFLDEAHKLPALVPDEDAIKMFLDSMLVITKQDRLCHVIHATSDPFYMQWLRQMNVGHHSKLLTVGDCTKEEIQEYYNDRLLNDVPKELQANLSFEKIYDYFGGKLAHWSDYLTEYTNTNGSQTRPSPTPTFAFIDTDMIVPQSTAFHQAYTSLRLHLSHALFPRYSPVPSHASPSPSDASSAADDTPSFSAPQLVNIMRKLVKKPYSVEYFKLCSEMGSDAVDAIVKSRLVELRWTSAISDDGYSVMEGDGELRFERPRIVAMTPVLRKAMEIVLREDQGGSDDKGNGTKEGE